MASVVVSSPAPSERDAERRSSKALSLSLDSPPGTSPFPSPSSSFLPPPVPSAHEFANKMNTATAAAKRKQRDSASAAGAGEPTAPASAPAPTGVNGLGHAQPSSKPAAPISSVFTAPSAANTELLTPTTKRMSLASQSHDLSPSVDEPSTPRHSKHASLSSSRPAPPSPSVSRRTSGAAAQSRPQSQSGFGSGSRPLSRAASTATKRQSQLATHTEGQQTSTVQPLPKLKIRDFAFPQSDPRHTGQGPDRPRLSVASTSSTDPYDDNDYPGSKRNSGWGAFRWGSKLWGFGFGSSGSASSSGSRAGGEEMPSKSDFARNFDISSPADEYPDNQYGGSFADDSQDTYSEEYSEEDYQDDAPLVPGLYRAMFAFDPEGTAEMALAEDQIVHVLGRGGGVGWAIAVRPDSGAGEVNGGGGGQEKHALVPESYLELVKADAEE